MENKYKEALIYISHYECGKPAYVERLKTLQELIDKATPKKVITDRTIYGIPCDKVQYICPNCNQIMLRPICITAHKPKYCYKCGQALDWSKNGK